MRGRLNPQALTRTNEGESRRSQAPYLPRPRVLPASSLQAGLRGPPPRDSRHRSPGHIMRQGAAAKSRRRGERASACMRHCRQRSIACSRRRHKRTATIPRRCHQRASANAIQHREGARQKANADQRCCRKMASTGSTGVGHCRRGAQTKANTSPVWQRESRRARTWERDPWDPGGKLQKEHNFEKAC